MKVYLPLPEKPEMPSAAEVAGNATRASLRLLDAVLHRRTLLVDDAEFDRRIDICQSCPKFVSDSNRCSVCGCYLKSKVLSKARLATENCPLEKW